METESDALISGQRLCAHPSGKMVIGLRANLSVVADALKIDVVTAVKGEAQRGLPGMLLPSINAGLHAAAGGGERPGERAAAHVSFKSAVPKNRTGRIDILRSVGEAQRIIPDAMRITDLMLLDEEIRERNRMGQLQNGMYGNQTLPNGERGGELIANI
jgi:hypothetical protein